MLSNRKNTSVVVSSWRDYLSGKPARKNLNEAVHNADGDREECFKALISDLLDRGWDDDRVDVLVIDVLKKCNISDEELEMIAYERPSSHELNNDKDMAEYNDDDYDPEYNPLGTEEDSLYNPGDR
jgi:hypothetical protein